MKLGKVDEAVTSYYKVLAVRPDYHASHSNLLLAQQYQLEQNTEKLYEMHKAWDQRHAQQFYSTRPYHLNTPDPNRVLRIGFSSPDLGWHPVGFFIVRLFESILENEIKIIVYSDRLADDLTNRIRAATGLWRDVNGISDEDLSKIILDDEIDILFDLTGHSAKNKMLLFARKPAPIQISWAGYVGTTGLSSMDYLLSDIHSTPEDEDKYYSEKVIRMPDGWLCYAPPDYAPDIGPLPFKQKGSVTFGSFSNPGKINEEVISVWAAIMNAVPNSCLLIKYSGIDTATNIERLTAKFAANGINKSRLVLEGQSPHIDLLARYNDVDIALDTFPYSGGLTTYEALWMGVPVITVPGDTFASRHSKSHLTTVGLPELIAENKDDYIRLAVELSGNAERMAELRTGLRSWMANSPICDGDRFTNNFTATMRKIWRDWCLTQDFKDPKQ
jgi:predicted O-linked N-acetylglucosamine transferase (SPINDLY family)